MDPSAFLERLKAGRHYRDQMVTVRCFDAHPADFAAPKSPLSSNLESLLRQHGITQLYRHQVDSLDAALAGKGDG